MRGGGGGDAGGGAHDGDESEVGRAFFLEDVKRLDGRATGGQHGIDAKHAAALEGREFTVVTAGDGGLFVAFHTDVADADGREHISVGLEHAETGAENGNDDEVLAQHGRFDRFEGGLDRDVFGGEISRRFEGQHHADLVAQGAKGGRLRRPVAQVGEDVCGEGVLENLGHERDIFLTTNGH